MGADFSPCLYFPTLILSTTLYLLDIFVDVLKKRDLPLSTSHQNYLCEHFFYAPCTVFVILLRSPHSFTSTYTQLDDGALPTVPFTWRTLQLAPLTSEEPTSPSLSLRETRNHPVLISRKLYSPAFVCFTSRLVFYSGSNVLNKAAWRGLFPWHGLSAR